MVITPALSVLRDGMSKYIYVEAFATCRYDGEPKTARFLTEISSTILSQVFLFLLFALLVFLPFFFYYFAIFK